MAISSGWPPTATPAFKLTALLCHVVKRPFERNCNLVRGSTLYSLAHSSPPLLPLYLHYTLLCTPNIEAERFSEAAEICNEIPPCRKTLELYVIYCIRRRSQWPSSLMRGSAAARLLGLRVRIPPRAWMFVVRVVCLSDRGLCDGLITRPEESYRLYCVIVCDVETSRMRRPKPASGL
jgi:hypothetical protein